MTRSPWQIFAAPIGVALVSLVGLVAALLGEGIVDAISWIALLCPLAVIGWALSCRRG